MDFCVTTDGENTTDLEENVSAQSSLNKPADLDLVLAVWKNATDLFFTLNQR